MFYCLFSITDDSLFLVRNSFFRNTFPQWKSCKKYGRKRKLNVRNDAVSSVPARRARKKEAHYVRTYRHAYSPEAVKPAHMPRLKMKRNVIVQCGINRAGSKSIRNSPQTDYKKWRCRRKTEKRCCRHKNRNCRNKTGTCFPRHPVAQKAWKNSSARNNHTYNSGIGKRHSQFHSYDRPGRTKKRIRKSKTNKGGINDRQ